MRYLQMKTCAGVVLLLICLVLQTMTASTVFSDIRSEPLPAQRRSVGVKPLVEVVDGRMTAKLESASLAKILAAIADKSGARIFVHGTLEETTVTTEFENILLEDGLRRLFPGRNIAIVYSSNTQRTGKNSNHYLSEAHIFSTAEGPSSQTTVFASKQSSNESNGARGKLQREELASKTADLAKRLLGANGGQAREAAEALEKIADQASIAPLSQALSEDADAGVRAAAAQALGKTWEEDAVAPLAQSLAGDSSAAVREAAARALGATWSDNAVQPLMNALSNDPDAMVREQAARALAQTAGEEAIDALVYALLADPRWFVRDAAAEALGAIGGRYASEALARAATNDGDAWVKETSALAAMNTPK